MLKEEIPEAIILGRAEAPHIVSVSMPGYRSEVIVNYMDGKGIYISKGSACKRGRRSHVLEAMNLDTGIIDSSFRVSFSRENTEADVRDFISALKSAKEELFTELR
jgi:cysteine desulfurase